MTKVAISFENTVKLGYNIQLGAGKIRSLKPGLFMFIIHGFGTEKFVHYNRVGSSSIDDLMTNK
jgi:hypothetical protein